MAVSKKVWMMVKYLMIRIHFQLQIVSAVLMIGLEALKSCRVVKVQENSFLMMVNCLEIWHYFQDQREAVSDVLMFELEALSKSCGFQKVRE